MNPDPLDPAIDAALPIFLDGSIESETDRGVVREMFEAGFVRVGWMSASGDTFVWNDEDVEELRAEGVTDWIPLYTPAVVR